MSFDEIVVRMVANAWYPIHYFRISFGKLDSLYVEIMALQQLTNLSIDAPIETICNTLINSLSFSEVKNHLRNLSKCVPYRFLSPWFPGASDKEVVALSRTFENDCPYAIRVNGSDKFIEINPSWESFLNENVRILLDYSYWNLTLFLQARNPNVPDIPNKLVKQIERNSLTKQRNYWNKIIDEIGGMNCIYTGKRLMKGQYDLDHFIPWSFVAHDQLWNLLPADPSINSSKSNKLPDLQFYLPQFAFCQQKALQSAYLTNPNNVLLEDFQALGPAVFDLVQMSASDFCSLYYKTMSPMIQIAENMGYEHWKRI